MADELNGLGGLPILRTFPDNKLYVESNATQNVRYLLNSVVIEFPGTTQEFFLASEERPHAYGFNFKWLDKASEKIFLDFQEARQGRHSKFWFQLPTNFFTFSAKAFATTKKIFVTRNRFSEFFRGFERIYVRKKDGDLITDHVLTIDQGPAPGEITLNLTTDLLADIEITDVQNCSLLLLARFNKDIFSCSHFSSRVGVVATEILELVKEYPP